MTALFDEPLRISISPDSPWAYHGLVGLLLGFVVNGSEGGDVDGILCLADGDVRVVPISDFRLDWRYDVEKDAWVDESAQRAAETAQMSFETDQGG